MACVEDTVLDAAAQVTAMITGSAQDNFGHSLTAMFLARAQPGREFSLARLRGGPGGGLAQPVGTHHDPLAVGLQPQHPIRPTLSRAACGVEGVHVHRGSPGQTLDLPLPNPTPVARSIAATTSSNEP